jgi:HAD superfamily hydrolase (TIGR01509 family)
VEDFVPILRNNFNIKIPDNYSLLEEFVTRFEKNEGMEEILNNRKEKYEMGLLTNMYPGLLNAIQKRGLLPEIDWKVVMDSSVLKCKKPEMEIYRLAQDMANTEANNILFIDNKKENLKSALELGWKTFWYDSADYERSNAELEKYLG